MFTAPGSLWVIGHGSFETDPGAVRALASGPASFLAFRPSQQISFPMVQAIRDRIQSKRTSKRRITARTPPLSAGRAL